MKKIIFNSNLFILLLLPVFVLAVAGILYRTLNVELPDIQTNIVGLFNRRTIFEVLCETIKNQLW